MVAVLVGMVVIITWSRYFYWLTQGMSLIREKDKLCGWLMRLVLRLRWFLVGVFGIALPIFITWQALGELLT